MAFDFKNSPHRCWSALAGAAILALSLLAPAAQSAVLWKKNAPEPLPVDAAFRLLPAEQENGVLHLRWAIAPGYYLYRDRLQINVVEPGPAKLPPPKWPSAESHDDGEGGKVAVFRNLLDLPITDAGTATRLRIRYQGCADAGLCYPPVEKLVDVKAAP